MSRWDDDEDLLRELRAAWSEAEAVPPHRREAARAAFAWRTIDEELLTLADAEPAGAAVRAAAPGQVLAFSGSALSVEVEVQDGQVLGQVLSEHPGTVTLESADGARQGPTRTDPSGFFTLDVLEGPVRFVVEVDGETHRTEWVVL